MNKIEWCLNQRNGLKLIEPNEDLATAYIRKAEDALKASIDLKNNPDWEISSSYYTMYFSLYAILMRIGIKSEIHSCTIEFMKQFLNKFFTEEDIYLIEKAQKARIDAQYYSDRNVSKETYNLIKTKRSLFFAKCKEILNKLDEKTINKIREELKENGN